MKEGERERGREIDFNDLAHVTVGAHKSKIYRAGEQAGNSSKS